MRTVRICDPFSEGPFPSFVHNTTTYVGIEHDRPSQLFAHWDGPCLVCIQSSGRNIVCREASNWMVIIPISDLPAPPPTPAPIAEWLRPLLGRHETLPRRLYAFAVSIQSPTPDRKVLSTYDFHILCPLEYGEALNVHNRLRSNPAAITPASIADQAEGRVCPYCRKVRHALQ